jgi:hypothetical protein
VHVWPPGGIEVIMIVAVVRLEPLFMNDTEAGSPPGVVVLHPEYVVNVPADVGACVQCTADVPILAVR